MAGLSESTRRDGSETAIITPEGNLGDHLEMPFDHTTPYHWCHLGAHQWVVEQVINFILGEASDRIRPLAVTRRLRREKYIATRAQETVHSRASGIKQPALAIHGLQADLALS